ncbi:hypothetical protein QTI66_13030 [Variovorax sp. J22R133]|uniref:hypothetical protein n=1 Tax=Variovorax brevis TaxID=3053503 RepID=UPI002575420E|nr:hypothetical protein [Variovorax sp. J22R133]MDM0113075.1 hypothetical protein [Variovorax sp. J22R133]
MTGFASAWPLWAGVVAVGVYHGLNPAMGWPLAVANGLAGKRDAAVFGSWVPLGAGHLMAMALVLVPFAVLAWLLQWSREIRVTVGVLVLLFGASKLFLPHRHRWLARIRPTQLALWSFLMATAHGAALMLLPILMGLCETPVAPSSPMSTSGSFIDHAAMMDLMRSNIGTAVMVSLVHTAAMIASGLGAAWVVYRYLGLRALRRAWLDLDKVWALGLVASGGAAVATALAAH